MASRFPVTFDPLQSGQKQMTQFLRPPQMCISRKQLSHKHSLVDWLYPNQNENGLDLLLSCNTEM